MKKNEKEKDFIENISFDDIRPIDNIDKESFTLHLKEIFKDLSETDKKNKGIGIHYNRFLDLIPDCPVFITSKFFKSLLKEKNNIKSLLTLNEFLTGLITLKFGTYEEVAKLIFNIFDFDQSGSIKTDDIKLLISFLPLNENNEKPEYLYQMESLNELDQIIKDTFNKETINIKFNDFLNYIDQKSNIFLMVYCYLYFIIPLFDKDIIIKHQETNQSVEAHLSPSSVQSNFTSTSGKRLVFSPNSSFSPITILRSKKRKNSSNEKEIKTNILDKLVNNESLFKKNKLVEPDTPITKSLKAMGVLPIELKSHNTEVYETSGNSTNYKSLLANSNTQKSDNSNIEELKAQIKKSTIIECSKESSNVDIFSSMAERELKKSVEQIALDDFESVIEKEIIKHEGELFMFKEVDGSLCINYFYLTLIGQSIYFYKDKLLKREDYYEFNYLPGSFFRENTQEDIGSNYFYSFSIIFPKEVKQFYHKEKEEIKIWIKHLREVLSYKDLFDFYYLGETIGKGEFGVIKAGFDKKTNEKVAIKILNKAKIKKPEQLISMRLEIDIMKHSKHPNIVKFIANYENSEFIFIVMELLNSGNLTQYLEKNKTSINEKMAANICKQIAEALLYLHKYGIIHRDIKPDNILVKKKNVKDDLNKNTSDIIELKLVDFGLSKILGNTETTKDAVGTIAYIAPEILRRRSYNFKVDVWSLGVLIYHILSGEIPFMPVNLDLEVMIINICKEDIKFSKKFEKISSEAIDLIKRCLEKNADKRISIEEVVNHNWFKSNK